MKIAIGCDHGGIGLKAVVAAVIEELGHTLVDQGCFSNDSVDYPDFADKVCGLVETGVCERGVLICGTGIGMSMAANRRPCIRAALVHEAYSARMSREHNDANVLCLGARVLGPGLAEDLVRVWLTTAFAGGRHQLRIAKFSDLEGVSCPF
ncbi:MAG: ribose 5-phosphate isomerase B [Deltaproteobacteria bacterium CG_4_10_14_3_um_filter_60_8]|nr:MAG: ribose 5-phosphate isomerase B [Desulfobacterales bacterium CG2_30_60_27]PIP44549.1 MAG: ribose 5-phosphate isomerase B [Deltaproteobacteria bacterium CG23_combo_of_CG06-09_8_20_14_all_60_8]PIY23731.1 MAG: ribose 5-phosphate isomerase B [Deltaproteobacteria bacterium CG_4_10_14_3_um_filter_60_8]